jgi:hypothetical protein
MSTNPLIELTLLGQSVWNDNIERKLVTSGELKRLVDEDGLSGVTSNPRYSKRRLSARSCTPINCGPGRKRQERAGDLRSARRSRHTDGGG